MMRLFLLSCLSLCCLVSVAFPTSSQLSNIAEEKVQEREKRKMSGRSRRSTQPSSTVQLSGCSQRKDLPRNCHHALLLGNSISGVYEIDPREGLGSFNVSCDMQTDGGGWTVFQRRKDGSENFFRVWDDYKAGFGELYGEFWLGLDKIHRLTATSVALRVDLAAPDNSKAYAKYEDFTIGSEKSMYVIYFGRYTGTAGDSLSFHKGMKFSTKDKDNDISSSVCARLWKGAWWYKDCHESNLNGEYRYGKHGGDTVVWHGNGGFKQTLSLQKTEMKLK